MRILAFSLVAALGTPVFAFAQSPSEQLKGRWVADSAFCGQNIFDITGVEPNGSVRGHITCVKTKYAGTFGDAVGKYTVVATFVGNHFTMTTIEGGNVDLVLNGNKLEGKGKANANSQERPAVYTKQ